MCALTMNNNVFVLVDDPYAPTRADIPIPPSGSDAAHRLLEPPHYRNTFLTLSPPGALEQLLALLRARWISTRQNAQSQSFNRQAASHQLTIEGNIFAIGNDWIVRAGNVILAGGAIKGMLLEAEYLPVPTMSSEPADKTSDLLSNLLLSVLPNVRDAKTVAVTISDAQWEDVLWDREEELNQSQQPGSSDLDKADDLFTIGDEDVPTHQKGDWVGVDRDRRSAFLIIGALKSEGLV
ncbi:hypothetical protein EVG20_g2835 [Dentipellis fragilis]|uniref:Mediator of RNA polymerase II transcription subunit 20 n=1 Tax=Dentipellis fragilis TaxID=205917 RepID=A0A4Y9Z8L5_9AGAM|nr:hypothetical protein EVG20_g2835 [Dentipellis fragilis]